MLSSSKLAQPTEQKTPMDSSALATITPEPIGTIMAKVGIVWTGLIAGISLGDIVLFATLIYTILQTVMLVVERIIKPILAAREVRRALLKTGVLSQSTPPQESKEK
jgi:hypothetical protein